MFDFLLLLIFDAFFLKKKIFNDSVEMFMDLLDFVEDGDKLENDLFRLNDHSLSSSSSDELTEPFNFLAFYYTNLLGQFEEYLKFKFDLKDSLKIEDFYESDEIDANSDLSSSSSSTSTSVKENDRLTLFQIMKLNQIAQSKDYSSRFVNKIFKFIYYSYGCLIFNVNKEFLRISIEIIISYAHMNRTATLNMIHLFISRNKNSIVNDITSYRITLNRAPFSLITRYVFKCYFKFANDQHYDEFGIDTLDMSYRTFVDLRLKCARIFADYIRDINQDIVKLNTIGGQAFSTILNNFGKVLFDMLMKIFDRIVLALDKNRYEPILDQIAFDKSVEASWIKSDLAELAVQMLVAMKVNMISLFF